MGTGRCDRRRCGGCPCLEGGAGATLGRMSRRDLLTAGCLGLLYLVWGSTYLAMRVAVVQLPPLTMAGGRFLLAGGLMLALMTARGARLPTARAAGGAALGGARMPGVGLGGAALVASRVSSGVVALAFGAVPLWTALFSARRGERPAALEALGLVLGCAGVAGLASRGELRADPLAACVLLGATLGYSLGCLAARRLEQPSGSMACAVQMLSGGVLLLLGGAVRGERLPSSLAAIEPRALLALGWLVVAGSMLAYAAFGWLIANVRPALATSYAFVNPIVALLLGAALGSERVTSVELTAAAAIVAAVGLLALGGAQPAGRASARAAFGGTPGTRIDGRIPRLRRSPSQSGQTSIASPSSK
jgi:drug/metabolite transporter (DMT)-like permease